MDIYRMIGRNIDVTEAMRNYTEEKLGKLDHFSERVVDAKVVISYAADGDAAQPAKVEVQLNVPHGIVRAEESGPDAYAAVDKVVSKLERQLRRFKERRLTRRTQDTPPPPPADLPDLPPLEDEQEDLGPTIARVKRHVLRPMSPEDAAMQMEALGHTFFMFRNMETEEINVLYLRQDGDYGLIEPGN